MSADVTPLLAVAAAAAACPYAPPESGTFISNRIIYASLRKLVSSAASTDEESQIIEEEPVTAISTINDLQSTKYRAYK
jgi:hypothetical protein